jgi:hypothetical protein
METGRARVAGRTQGTVITQVAGSAQDAECINDA